MIKPIASLVAVFLAFTISGCTETDNSTFSSTPLITATVDEQYEYEITVDLPTTTGFIDIKDPTLPSWLAIEFGDVIPVSIGEAFSGEIKGVAADDDGSIYSAVFGEGIYKTSADGSTQILWTDAICKVEHCNEFLFFEGSLYISNYSDDINALEDGVHALQIAASEPTPRLFNENPAYAIATDGYSLYTIDNTLAFTQFALTGPIEIEDIVDVVMRPFGLAFGDNGDVYAALEYPGTYYRFDNKYELLETEGFRDTFLSDIEVDDRNSVYVSASYTERTIYKVSGDTRTLISAGGAHEMTLSPTGQLIWGDVFTNTLQKLNTQSVRLKGTPSLEDLGDHEITLTLENDETQTFTITVSLADVPSYSIGGTANNLSGDLVLQNNAGDHLTISAVSPTDESFTFATKLPAQDSYDVRISTQPEHQTCTVTSGDSGTVVDSNITSVQVDCEFNTYSVGGSVSGLTGTLALQVGSQNLSIDSNGDFTFDDELDYNAAYDVTVATQPNGQQCEIENATGTVASAVNNITVTCTNAAVERSLNVTVVGLPDDGTTVALRVFSGVHVENKAFSLGTSAFDHSPVDGDDFDYRIIAAPAGYGCNITDETPLTDTADGYGIVAGDVTVTISCNPV